MRLTGKCVDSPVKNIKIFDCIEDAVGNTQIFDCLNCKFDETITSLDDSVDYVKKREVSLDRRS